MAVKVEELATEIGQSVAHTSQHITQSELRSRIRAGDVVVLDVRPTAEYAAGHISRARSLPLADLTRRLRDLPKDTDVVAYCRGPYWSYADDAVRLLRRRVTTPAASKTATQNGPGPGYRPPAADTSANARE